MKTGDLAKLFGVSNTTIQAWAARYEDFLSEKRGFQRQYDENDVLALATIAKLSSEGVPHEQIMERLQAGERVDDPQVANFGVDLRMVPAAAVEQMIDATEIKLELEKTKSDLEKALQMLSEERQRNAEKDQKIEALQGRIEDLQYKLGRAEMEAQIRREMDEKRRD